MRHADDASDSTETPHADYEAFERVGDPLDVLVRHWLSHVLESWHIAGGMAGLTADAQAVLMRDTTQLVEQSFTIVVSEERAMVEMWVPAFEDDTSMVCVVMKPPGRPVTRRMVIHLFRTLIEATVEKSEERLREDPGSSSSSVARIAATRVCSLWWSPTTRAGCDRILALWTAAVEHTPVFHLTASGGAAP